MIHVDHDVIIQRPIADVFAFLTDTSTFGQWQAAVIEFRQTTSGPMRVGACGVNVRQEMGRRIESTWECTELTPNAHLVIRSTSGPVSYEISHVLEPNGVGTHLRARFQGDARGFFKLAEPLIASTIRQQFAHDCDRLKQLLEHQ